MLRGTVVDYARLFEEEPDKKLAAAGKGDIAAANLTITRGRQKLVDFTVAGLSSVSEVVVTGPASPPVTSLDDLSGNEVFVRRSSSCYESLLAPNKKFAAAKKPPFRLKECVERLADEDLLEMVNGGEIAWAIRKGSPQLKTALDEFATRNKSGTAIGNQLLARYLKGVKYVKDAASGQERQKFPAFVQYFRKYGDLRQQHLQVLHQRPLEVQQFEECHSSL